MAIRVAQPINQIVPLLRLAYSIMFLPRAMVSVRAALYGAASSPEGVEARVVDVSCFGHDASAHLEVLASGRRVTARVCGLSVPMPDPVVHLSVRGPVAAYGPEL